MTLKHKLHNNLERGVKAPKIIYAFNKTYMFGVLRCDGQR